MNSGKETESSKSLPAKSEQSDACPLCLRRGLGWLTVFLSAQVLLVVVLKGGTMFPGWYGPCIVVGGSMTLLTTWLLMRVFAYFPPHLAQALAVGVSFVLSQVALAALVRVWLTPGQSLGIATIFIGIFLLSKSPAPKEGDA